MQMPRTTTKHRTQALHIIKSLWAALLHQRLPIFSRTSLEGRLSLREQKETGPPGQGWPREHPSHRRKITMKTNQTKNHKTEKPRSSILHKQNSRMKKKNISHNPKSRCCPLCVNTGNCRHITQGVSIVAPLRSGTLRATSVLAVLRAVCQIKLFTFYFCLKREFLP